MPKWICNNVVPKEGITVDPKEISAVMEWKDPRNVDDLISFIGLASYYMRLIKNFLAFLI